MKFTNDCLRRKKQAEKWFAPARFGLFYHWGLFTGGGDTTTSEKFNSPLMYATPQELETAAGAPEAVAKNMVDIAAQCGARYITLTALHSCDGYCVIYPTKLEGFRHKTSVDYFGAFVREASSRGIYPIVYMPCGPEHWHSPGGPWLKEGYRDKAAFAQLLSDLVDELVELHDSRIAGFWIDGMTDELRFLPARMHAKLPDCIVINNNNTFLDLTEVDYGTTEFLAGIPEPAYCRPDALRKVQPDFSITPPGSDFNEDIPACNGWWYRGEKLGQACQPYVKDANFLVRQMISSLGQRGQWNFSLGLGPMVNGKMPEYLEPSFARLGEFMQWASEAIYNTTGGERSFIRPGWFNAPWSKGGFCSVTTQLADPLVHYVLVTTAPLCNKAGFHTGGRIPESVINLRTGKELEFTMMAGVILDDIDWSDVERYGAKVFKIVFAKD